jgi:hypothetical protein
MYPPTTLGAPLAHLVRIIDNLLNKDSSPITSACEKISTKVVRFDDFIE